MHNRLPARTREQKCRIRTFGAVSAGAALFTVVGMHFSETDDSSRIIANIITGVGFLGAGIIYNKQQSNESSGLTTAANVWAVSAIGVAAALGFYVISAVTTALLYFMLSLNQFGFYRNWQNRIQNDKDPKQD
ncbi:MgtC/SapB family protein [Flavobacterium sp. GSP11]|uniref:MgtC/SapB family protein n=1 Tax=Flavobacterium sp. GSP11 TaxID=3401730 RepID=UPI003AAD6E73